MNGNGLLDKGMITLKSEQPLGKLGCWLYHSEFLNEIARTGHSLFPQCLPDTVGVEFGKC